MVQDSIGSRLLELTVCAIVSLGTSAMFVPFKGTCTVMGAKGDGILVVIVVADSGTLDLAVSAVVGSVRNM